MSTTFFQQQDTARRNTGRLVLLFVLAVLALIGLTYLVVYGLFVYSSYEQSNGKAMPGPFQPWLFLGVAGAVSFLIFCGSAYKIAQLAAGGQAVALLLGGQEIPGNTRELREKRLLNIVEEMAIASGVPVPPVYLLPDEKGINAFAAGFAPGSAVVAVSQGCLNYLTRDELQGVVAHEFSHILNGDMRLNIRLTGMIHGIVVVSLVGLYLMDAMSRSRGGDDNKGALGLFLLGLALYILGSVGAFFGMLIQAAVSRQREFLADASAIQFTRNPDGIGGALKKIGGMEYGSKIKNAHAAEVSHMFFGDAIANRVMSMLATHPPLEVRIKAVDPYWDGNYPEVKPINVEQEEAGREKKAGKPPLTIPGMPQLPIPVPAAVLGFAADAAEQRIGAPSAAGLSSAAAFTEAISDEVRDILGEPFSARAFIYALLLDSDEQVRGRQLALLRSEADARDFEETLRLTPKAQSVPPGTRLTVAHLAIPALRSMSPRQYQLFRQQVENLIKADQAISLFEFCLQRVILHHLDQAFELTRPPRVRYRTEERLHRSAACIIGMLAYEGNDNAEMSRKAFAAGYGEWLNTGGNLPESGECTQQTFSEALDNFAEAAPFLKKKLIRGCVACIVADRQITATEYELLRAICSSLDCPLPPLSA